MGMGTLYANEMEDTVSSESKKCTTSSVSGGWGACSATRWRDEYDGGSSSAVPIREVLAYDGGSRSPVAGSVEGPEDIWQKGQYD